jgi:hypothetical protein
VMELESHYVPLVGLWMRDSRQAPAGNHLRVEPTDLALT